MAQYAEPTPLEERASKKITLGQFLRETWPVPVAWLGGGALGFLFSRTKGYAKGGAAEKFAMMIPAKLGAFAAFFMVWQKKEKQHIGIGEIYDKYRDARALRMNNDDLMHENAVLQKMVDYEERQTPASIQSILAQGPKNMAERVTSAPEESPAR